MASQAVNQQINQVTTSSVMPLRIALLVLPCGDIRANSLATLLPELSRAGLAIADNIVNITVDNFDDASFEKQLNRTINAIENGKLVQLATAEHALLMMPALTAAQLRIHPHAQLHAMQQSNSPNDCSLTKALAQAKREKNQISRLEQHDGLNSKAQFTALHQLICQLARRTLYRNTDLQLTPKQAKSHYWFTQHHQARVAAISFNNGPQSVSFVIAQGSGFLAAKSLLTSQRLQFIVSGNNQTELTRAVAALDTELAALTTSSSGLLQAMQTNLHRYVQMGGKAKYCAVLQASSVAAMQLELAALSAALAQTIAAKTQYKTPSGSYFTACPLGSSEQAGLAFVYPGVGTVYADMLNELHEYFPKVYAQLEREGDFKAMLQAEHIYHSDPKHVASMNLSDLAIAGVGSSYLLSQLLMDQFNIKPNFALGYSMGEASMWVSLGVWKHPHSLINKTQTAPLFTSAISGQLTAVRQAWQLSHVADDIAWNSYVVRSSATAIEALLPDHPHVYLAIVQGDTCVIAGCERQCGALLAALGKRGIAANRVTAMHTPPAIVEHANVVNFYQQPLHDEQPKDIKFISAASLHNRDDHDQAISPLTSQVIAQSIADTFCYRLDFSALIHSAQRQGAKLFVELGADRQTCTLIDKITKQDSHQHALSCTVPTNTKGSSDAVNLLKALAQLISHGVPLSVAPLIDGLTREIARSTLRNDTITPKGEV
ncbi:PfaB family protein [Shewanella youngdeokensis]|uniref:PfaB family protein n=1 Tax=Shewanella youngdeokensis TaxID=2999068 RepID=A0ABZ0K0L0_9GAMM|nr:PfaB family protein [Shewanella sp. DAU334]